LIRHSGATERNPNIVDWTEDYSVEDNVRFFAAALRALAEQGKGNGGLMTIGLLGQRDLPGFNLRHAQSILRWDLRPSLWSHVLLIAAKVEPSARAVAAAPVREVVIYSRTGDFADPADNAVTAATLGEYRRAGIDSNAALLAVDMTDDEAAEVAHRAIDDPNLDRTRFNLWEMLGVWQSYLWSSGARSNPLRDGLPIHSSAFVEYCFEAIRLDLSPGASERNSAPEHIWNGAVWWDETLSAFGHRISGYYVLRDKGCSLLDPGELREEVSA
jgi:hypothetical protein